MRRSDADGTVALLRRLSAAGARLAAAPDGSYRFAGANGRRVAAEAVTPLLSAGLVVADGAGLVISAAGLAFLRRALSGREADAFAAQHQPRAPAPAGDAVGAAAEIDLAESPLAWLRRRRGADGEPLIDAAAFAAGERLRADFTRGQMTPRLTANWDAAGGRRRSGSAGRGIELNEAALAARIRVERALDAVDPEFAGLLLDFCCFLKGLEEVERDRRWPARSAKLVLRLALSALARHYGIGSAAEGGRSPIRHWGSADYRPRAG